MQQPPVPEIKPRPRFWSWVWVWTAVGLAIRLGSVFGRLHRTAGGDPGYFHAAANVLVQGHGFVNPFIYLELHRVVQTAAWPPLFVFLLAIPAALGFHGFLASRICSCFIGAGAIVVSGGAGREIGGRRVGLIVAFVMAVYPNIWDNSELAAVEALTPLLVALVLWTAYRFWRNPTLHNAVLTGLSIGVAALGRDELALLAPFIFIPLALLSRQLVRRRRWLLAAVGVGMSLVVVMPWVGYNLSRFEKPVFISSGLGNTLATANCHETYYGTFEGYWFYNCIRAIPQDLNADESVNVANDQKVALHYARTHLGRLPVVILARIGRGFGLYRPVQQIRFDSLVETRPYHWAMLGLGMYYLLFILSLGGAVVLRRRHVPQFPLWMIGVDVLLSMILAFGQTRYRIAFESSLVILAAVQIDALWTQLHRLRSSVDDAEGHRSEHEELVTAPIS